MAEYKFTFFVYDLTDAEAKALQEKIESLLLNQVDAAGKFISPLNCEVNDGEEQENPGTV